MLNRPAMHSTVGEIDLGLKLKIRNDLHLARKSWHLIMGLVIVFCYLAGTSRASAIYILGSVLGVDLILESIRLRAPGMNEKLIRFFAPLLRSHEMNRMSTAPHYLASVIIAIAIFPKSIAVLSVLYLACGDPIASLVGILYGDLGPRFKSGKSLIGSLAGIAVCFLVSLAFLNTLPIEASTLWTLSIVGGIAGGTAELLPFDVDDNFSIPIISGFALWVATLFVAL